MMKTKYLIPVIVLFSLIISACTQLSPSDNGIPAVDNTYSTQEGIMQVVNANNQFAFEIYEELEKTEKGKNIFYSPYSISSALAMTNEGAKGQTEEEINSVFHFPEKETLRPNFAAIYKNINEGSSEYELKTGNALWVQEDYPFNEEYLAKVKNFYGGEAKNVDFVKETELTRQKINNYIEDQTNNRIKDLISKGVLGPMTRLVLTNAVYFKGTWEWEFEKSDTRDMDFRVNEEKTVKAEMMHMNPEKARFNYADTGKVQILELPYKGDRISMLVILPKQGADYDFETGEMITYNYSLKDIEFSSEKISEYKSQMKETKLDNVFLPKFEFDTKYSMKNTLSSMGMPTAFTGDADFSGMTSAEKLFISEVIHQAFVKVDEEGTEAAAATAVVMKATSIQPSNIFKADHPFLFLIQQKETGNILFAGRVIDPTLKN